MSFARAGSIPVPGTILLFPAPLTTTASSRVFLSTFDEDKLIEAVKTCQEELGAPAAIAFVFASSDWAPHLADLQEIVQVYGRATHVVGCSADGIIGEAEESENVSGVSLMFLAASEAEIHVAHLSQDDVASSPSPEEWAALAGKTADTHSWIAMANPATFDGESWLRQWNAAFPGTPVFGGLASGARRPEDFFVFHNGKVNPSECIAIGFGKGIRLEGVVSQGCRPIGEPYTITATNENVIYSIASKPAYTMLEEAVETLDPDTRQGVQGNIFAGLATSEYLDDFKRGDFLVRNILGGDPDAGAIALGAFPRVGQTLQFQLRDGDTADEDLRIRAKALNSKVPKPAASLLFSCTGRGSHLFGVPNHDAGVLADSFGPLPSAGFFCNGEIGPVGDTNYVHGYTASAVFFIGE